MIFTVLKRIYKIKKNSYLYNIKNCRPHQRGMLRTYLKLKLYFYFKKINYIYLKLFQKTVF